MDIMDIDKELDQIIFKYGIDRYNPAYRNYAKAREIIQDLYARLESSYGKIVIVSEKRTDIGYFSDFAGKKCGHWIIENPVLPDMGKLSGFSGDECFLVVSLNYRHELHARLSEKLETVLDLYDFFEDEGIFFGQNYYEIYPAGYHAFGLDESTSDYEDFKMGIVFMNHRNRFEDAKDRHQKEKYLGEMIFDCAHNRDFLLLGECVRRYRDSGYSGSEGYVHFLEEVEALLDEIKARMHGRNKEDAVMYWLDTLEYGEDSEMPFLKGLDETSLCMDNMYTVTPYTPATFKTLFAKMRVIEEQSYDLKIVTKEDARLIQELEERGYSLVCYGPCEECEEEFRTDRYVLRYADFTLAFWTFLKDVLLEPDKKYFAVIHETYSTHYPYISFGYSERFFTTAEYVPGLPKDEYQANVDRQHRGGFKYVDRHLEFYDGMLPGSALKIYMSDHGHTYQGRYHVVMKLQQDGISPQRCGSIVSYFDFDKFILGIIDRKEVPGELLNKEYVLVQDSEYMSRQYILDSIKKRDLFETFLLGYRGVITNEDMLVCHRRGCTYYPLKYYRKHVNDGSMVTHERMEYLERLMGDRFVDLDSSDAFKYSRMIVNSMKNHLARTKDVEDRKWRIISRVVAEALDLGVTAVRGGGMHTEKLLTFLDDDVRERIGYVIDCNKECAASRFGVRIIPPEEIDEHGIECVVISSLKYREIWKKEFEGNERLRVFDFYAAMEAAGIACDKEFFLTQDYQRQDFADDAD